MQRSPVLITGRAHPTKNMSRVRFIVIVFVAVVFAAAVRAIPQCGFVCDADDDCAGTCSVCTKEGDVGASFCAAPNSSSCNQTCRQSFPTECTSDCPACVYASKSVPYGKCKPSTCGNNCTGNLDCYGECSVCDRTSKCAPKKTRPPEPVTCGKACNSSSQCDGECHRCNAYTKTCHNDMPACGTPCGKRKYMCSVSAHCNSCRRAPDGNLRCLK
jgi:hypothetical protein